MPKPKLHIIEGPVGSGKTTFALQLGRKHASPPLILDRWMARLFRPDRPDHDMWTWYAERKVRCEDQILDIAEALLQAGHHAIVELGLLQHTARQRVYQRMDATAFDCRVHVLQVPDAERWSRVQKRNSERGETFVMDVSAALFQHSSARWEKPDREEQAERDIRFLTPADQKT